MYGRIIQIIDHHLRVKRTNKKKIGEYDCGCIYTVYEYIHCLYIRVIKMYAWIERDRERVFDVNEKKNGGKKFERLSLITKLNQIYL